MQPRKSGDIDFLRCSRTANFVVNCRIWTNFEFYQAFMVVLITCKNEEVLINQRGAKVAKNYTTILDAQGQLTP